MPRKHKLVRVERGLYLGGDVYVACVTPTGSRRPRWRTLGKMGIIEARRRREEFAVELRAGKLGHPGRVTFADVAEQSIAHYEDLAQAEEIAPRTLDAHRRNVRLHLVPAFGARQVAAIEPDELVRWIDKQRTEGIVDKHGERRPASQWTIKQRWTALRVVLGHATRIGAISSNPADKLTRRERPSAGAGRKRFLSDDEMRSLISATRKRYRPLVGLGLFGGLRIAEALGLVWGEVDFKAGVIRLRHQLGRNGERVKLKSAAAQRDIVLMPALAHELRKHKAAAMYSRDHQPVFATDSGRHVSARQASKRFETATERAGLEDVTSHALRHTFASLLIAQGHDPVFVADQLGHKDPSTTLRVYAHLFRAARQAREAREQLEADYGSMLRQGSE